jgi:hypothetical protein
MQNMRHIKFVLLNIVYVAVTIIVFGMSSGVSRIGAEQADDYFANFYGPEVQRTASGEFVRNMRWAAQDGLLYLIRHPNDDGFNIMAVTATTVIENQSVEIEIDNQRVIRFGVQPQVFRKYQSLVRLDWQPLTFWDGIRLKNSATALVDGRKISLAVSDVLFTPLTKMYYPNGVMLFYLVMVLLLGTWVYWQFSPKMVTAAYSVFGVVLVGMWWWGVQSMVVFGLTHTPLVWLIMGLIGNGIFVYYLFRYISVLQQVVQRGYAVIAPRFVALRGSSTPVGRCVVWLWQRPVMLYTLVVVLYFCPWIWQQQVISPINMRLAANLPVTEADYTTTSIFTDYVFYLSEEHMLMNSPRANWLSTWSDMTQLGRPITQLHGWSVSYVLTWIMRIFITDPYVFFTVTFVFYLYLAGLFALLYVQRILQHTGFALFAAYLIAASPFFFYWNTYLTFVAATCWTIGLLYGLTWLRDTPHWKPALFLTFVIYSLLCMGYQQMIIHVVYMMSSYFCYVLWQLRSNRSQQWKFIGYTVVAAIVGSIMVVPIYLDTIQAATLATVRQTLNVKYFYDVMPYFHTVKDVLRTGLTYILKDIFVSNTDFHTVIYPYRGGYTSLFVGMLMVIGAIWRWRDTWSWSAWVVIAVLFSFSRSVFIFGYEQLHLPQLSRAVMFYGAGQQIPEMVLAVYGLHVIISDTFIRTTKILIGMVSVSIVLIMGATLLTFARDAHFQWVFMGVAQFIALELIVVGCVIIMALVDSVRIKMIMAFGVLSLQLVFLLQPMLLTQSTAKIIDTSPSTVLIQQTLQLGERMAMVDELTQELANARATYNELTPFGLNYNVVLQLPQIGTYHPLQPKYYVALMKRFGVDYSYYKPYTRKINLPMPENDQWMANVRTIVSKNPVNDPNLVFAARTNGFIPFYVYTTPSTMGCCLQVPLSDVRIVPSAQQDDYWIDTPKAVTNRQLQKSVNQGDRFVVPVAESTTESIIVFSQIFHPQWHARVRMATGWQDATPVVVNEAYQGVRVPVGAQEVVMEFRPWSFWSIIPNLFWLGCALLLLGRWTWAYVPIQSFVQQLRKRITV